MAELVPGVYSTELTMQHGRIWTKRPRVGRDGLLTILGNRRARRNSATRVAFTATAFNARGDAFAAADRRGAVFVFHVALNRYACLKEAKLGAPAYSLDFVRFRPSFNSIVLGLGDARHTVLCLNGESGRAEKTLSGQHHHPVVSVSSHPTRALLLSTSSEAVILWDSDTWSKLHALSGPGGLAVVAARFLVDGERIGVLFRDDAVLMWSTDSFGLLSRLTLPPHEGRANLRCFAATRDGSLVVAGGSNAMLYLWDAASEVVVRVAELPPSASVALQLEFIADSHELLILSDDGRLLSVLFTPTGGCAIQLELAPPACAFTGGCVCVCVRVCACVCVCVCVGVCVCV